ncbi:hypothetical protein Emag_003223 [Eimeria magna]
MAAVCGVWTDWPKPGQVPETPGEKDGAKGAASAAARQQQQQQHNYDPHSFAFKVLQNARPVGQKGFAIPANVGGSSGGPTSSRQDVREGEEGKGQGKAGGGVAQADDQQQQQQQQGPNKRIIILAELPPPISVEEIKRAVAERLAGFNQGQCVDVRKPSGGRTFGVIIELDTTQSAQYLVDNGFALNGRQLRIDFVRPRGPNTGLGRGGRGTPSQRGPWEDRRVSGEARRGNRVGGGAGGASQVMQERQMPAEEADEEGQGQWIDPAARRRPRPPRGGGAGFGGGSSGAPRGRGGGSGFRGGGQRGHAQE